MIGLVGFKTKKAFKDAVAAAKGGYKMEGYSNYMETSAFGAELVPHKAVPFVGPDAYNKRSWYGNVTVNEEMIVTKVS
jgi:hypothetical protein